MNCYKQLREDESTLCKYSTGDGARMCKGYKANAGVFTWLGIRDLNNYTASVALSDNIVFSHKTKKMKVIPKVAEGASGRCLEANGCK